jgi:hypothetical protein
MSAAARAESRRMSGRNDRELPARAQSVPSPASAVLHWGEDMPDDGAAPAARITAEESAAIRAKAADVAKVQPNDYLDSRELAFVVAIQRRAPIVIGVVVLFCAAVMVTTRVELQQGTGVVIATIIAGFSWALKQALEESRARLSIASGYISAIDRLRRELVSQLSDDELDRFRQLAPHIRAGRDGPSWKAAKHRLFDDLPELKDRLHLLAPSTVEALTAWSLMHSNLSDIYDMLGTSEMMQLSDYRLDNYFRYVASYRAQYETMCDKAVERLEAEIGHAFLRRIYRALRAARHRVRVARRVKVRR